MRQADGLVRIGIFQYEITFELEDSSGALWRLLQLLNGTRSGPQAMADLLAEFPGIEPGRSRRLVPVPDNAHAASAPRGTYH